MFISCAGPSRRTCQEYTALSVSEHGDTASIFSYTFAFPLYTTRRVRSHAFFLVSPLLQSTANREKLWTFQTETTPLFFHLQILVMVDHTITPIWFCGTYFHKDDDQDEDRAHIYMWTNISESEWQSFLQMANVRENNQAIESTNHRGDGPFYYYLPTSALHGFEILAVFHTALPLMHHAKVLEMG